METVTVKILEGGKTCREVNFLGEKPVPIMIPTSGKYEPRRMPAEAYDRLLLPWLEVENNLRTWEIANIIERSCGIYIAETKNERVLLIEESTHKAQIINGKAIII